MKMMIRTADFHDFPDFLDHKQDKSHLRNLQYHSMTLTTQSFHLVEAEKQSLDGSFLL